MTSMTEPPPPHPGGIGTLLSWPLTVIDHKAASSRAQLSILCQVQRLLITLLLTLYRLGQCLTDSGIRLSGIYLPSWHKSNMIL